MQHAFQYDIKITSHVLGTDYSKFQSKRQIVVLKGGALLKLAVRMKQNDKIETTT